MNKTAINLCVFLLISQLTVCVLSYFYNKAQENVKIEYCEHNFELDSLVEYCKIRPYPWEREDFDRERNFKESM